MSDNGERSWWEDLTSGHLFDPESDRPLERINFGDVSEYVYDRGVDLYGDDLDEVYLDDLLDRGWRDPDVSYEDRFEAREELLDYLDWETDDFPWELWAEWYEG